MQPYLFEIDEKRNNYAQISKDLSGKDFLTPDEFGMAIKKWSSTHFSKKIKVLGLFSGAGGLDIGFHDAGFDILETVELEPKFVKSQLKNKENGNYLTETNIICQDIRDYNPQFSTPIDFIIGGPPCQSFSAAGRRAAGVSGTKDSRGGLFWEYVRILENLQPKGFLFENVYGLLGAEKGEAIKKIKDAFRSVGYNLSYRILDAADYGVPQHRERLIIVGLKEGTFKFPKPCNGVDSQGNFPHYSAKEALSGLNVAYAKEGLNGRFGHLLKDVPPGLNYSFFTEKMGHPEPIFAWRSKFSDFLYKADPNMPVRTLKASGGQYTGPFHWKNRKFTLEELKRLQTFPDDYVIEGNFGTGSKQIGNSVPPQFARFLALSILDQVFEVDLPFSLNYLDENEKLSFRRQKSKRTKLYAKIAKSAIDKITPIDRVSIKPRRYNCSLTSNFKFTESYDGTFCIRFEPSINIWTFKLTDAKNSSEDFNYEIRVEPSQKEFLFNEVRSVSIKIAIPDLIGLTIGWKALEHELTKLKIKADLVQLSGYYQYSSNLKFDIKHLVEVQEEKEVWKVIGLISSDPKIGEIQPLSVLALRYEMDEDRLLKVFKVLRKIGFEVRNHNTNPEIAPDSYLIPYKFPTLTPQSVQLNKKL